MSEPDDLLPVRDRVAASPAYVPEHAEVDVWRAATPADLEAVTELWQAIDAADHPEWRRTREEVEEYFGYSFVDLAEDTLLGFTAGGRPVALGLVTMPPIQETIV